MAIKTQKEIQYENSKLKEEVNNLKIKNGEPSNKVKNHSECRNCNKNSINLNNLKKNEDNHVRCVRCEREFDNKWKLSAHMKMHERYKCGKCEKTFR